MYVCVYVIHLFICVYVCICVHTDSKIYVKHIETAKTRSSSSSHPLTAAGAMLLDRVGFEVLPEHDKACRGFLKPFLEFWATVYLIIVEVQVGSFWNMQVLCLEVGG